MSIIDTATWTNRVIDPGAGMARSAARVVLACDGERVAVPRGRGRGLTAYRADGHRLFRVLHGTQINLLENAAARAYAVSERVVHTVNLTTARVVSEHTVPAARVSVTLIR